MMLMIDVQHHSQQTGSLDICYFNYLYKTETKLFDNYEHIVGNASYIICGAIFILLVAASRERRRNAMIKLYNLKKNPAKEYDQKTCYKIRKLYSRKHVEHLNQVGVPEKYGICF